MSAYSASKHAAEAFTTAIRNELGWWGVKVRPNHRSILDAAELISWRVCVRGIVALVVFILADHGSRMLMSFDVMWGLHQVINMNPAFHATPIQQNAAPSFRKAWAALSEEKKTEYGEPFLEQSINVRQPLPCLTLDG